MTPLTLPMDVETFGEKTVVTMVLPFLPPSKNVFDAWPQTWKSSAKRKWKTHIARLAQEHQLPSGLWEVGLAATLYFASNVRRDPQNYAQCIWNWVPDGLVECGVLRDDRAGAVQIGPNWGVRLAVDDRRSLPKKARERTVLSVAYRQPHDD